MAEGLSTTLVSNWLNTLRSAGAAFGPVAGTFVQLHTANPGAAGTTAVSAGSATRIAATFAASSGGSALALSGSVGPWTNGGTSETITEMSVMVSDVPPFVHGPPEPASANAQPPADAANDAGHRDMLCALP